MLIAARWLALNGHFVNVFEERPLIGGAWIAPGLCGLKHRHANLIVAYNDDDLAALEAWRDFLFGEMNMMFEPVPHALINMSTEYHTAFDPDFAYAYASEPLQLHRARIESVAVDGESVKVNCQSFDCLLVPAFCSMRTFTINGVPYEFPFDKTMSLHVICEDHANLLDYVYVEGNVYLFDRYFKSMESGIFVARVERNAKDVPGNEMKAKLDKYFRLKYITEYISNYRDPVRFDEFKGLEGHSGGRIFVIDTRQFCWGLKDVTALGKLEG